MASATSLFQGYAKGELLQKGEEEGGSEETWDAGEVRIEPLPPEALLFAGRSQRLVSRMV